MISNTLLKFINEEYSDEKAKGHHTIEPDERTLNSLNSMDKDRAVFIKGIMSMAFKDEENHFVPFFVSASGESTFSVECITEEDWLFISELSRESIPLIIAARLFDLLWVERHDYQAAKKAIAAYKELYILSFDLNHWTVCERNIVRALNVAVALGKKSEEFKSMCRFLESELLRIDGSDPLFFSLRLIEDMKACSACKSGPFYVSILDKIISKNENDPRKIENAFELKLSFVRQDKQAVKQCHLDFALFYSKYANTFDEESYDSVSSKVQLLGNAVQEFREASDNNNAQKLLLEISRIQKKIPKLMSSITLPITITEKDYEEAFDLIEKRSFRDAIKLLTSFVHFQNREEIKSKLINADNRFFSTRFFTTNIIDDSGRTVALIPPIDTLSPEKDPSVLEKHMHHDACSMESIEGMLAAPLFEKIRNTFNPTKDEIKALIKKCVLIPKDRLEVFVSALELAFSGDIYLASHILAPQMENLFRYIAEQVGDVVISFDDEQVTSMKSLRPIFNLPNLKECFDNNILFTFQGLLNEPTGANIRNVITHGIMPPSEASGSSLLIYFICIVLKLLTENYKSEE